MVTKKTGEFTALDENGKRYRIIKYTDFENAPTYGANETVQGNDEYRLPNGEPVHKISDTEFFAVVSEYFFEQPDLLRSNHPDLYEMLARIFRAEG